MSQGGFERVEPLGDGFIRGPARILVAPYSAAWPTEIANIINLSETGGESAEQKISKFAEAPTEGTFYLGFQSYPTSSIAYGATGEEIAAALAALPGIGTGNIECTAPTKKLSEEALTFKFKGELAEHAQPTIQVLRNTCKKSSTIQALSVSVVKKGKGLYDPEGSWSDLGATKGGIKIMRNNTESLQDIDQIQAAVAALPDEWEMSVEAPMAETSLQNIEVAWEGEVGTPNTTPTIKENQVGYGSPLEYKERRLAVIYKGTMGTSAGKLKAFCFRRVTRAAASSSLDFQKTGNMATINTTFRCFADGNVSNLKFSMGTVYTQNYF